MSRVLALAALWLGCATTKAPVADAPVSHQATPPTDVQVEAPRDAGASIESLFARELPEGRSRAFTVGGVELRAEASADVAVARDDATGSHVVTLPLGTEQDLTCFAYDRPVDVANALSRLIESVRAQHTVLAVRPFALDVVEKAPALFVEVLYAVEQPGGRRVGSLKLMALSSEAAPVTCLHDEPGYTQTFRRAATSFAAALARTRAFEGPPQRYRTIAVTSLRGVRVGFTRTSWLKRIDGTEVFFSVTSRFVPRSATDALAEDSATITEADATGIIRRRRTFTTVNGQRTLELDLVQQKRSRYAYSGEVSGKPLRGTVESKDPNGLACERIELQRTREDFLAGKVTALSFEGYYPETNPVGLETATLSGLDSSSGVFKATLELAKLRMPVVLDANGDVLRAELSAGPVTLVTEQVFREGAP